MARAKAKAATKKAAATRKPAAKAKTVKKTAASRKPAARGKTAPPARKAPPVVVPRAAAAAAPAAQNAVAKSPLERLTALAQQLGAPSVDAVVDLAERALRGLGTMPANDAVLVTVPFDGATKSKLLSGSRNPLVRQLMLTEGDLLDRVEHELGMPRTEVVHAGAIAHARRALSNAMSDSTESRGRFGANYEKFDAAVTELRRLGLALTATRIATEAKVSGGYRQAMRYMEIRGIPTVTTPASPDSEKATS